MQNKENNIMKTLTLDEILNSDLLNDMITQEDKDLKDAGWTYKEVKEIAKAITNK